MKNDLKTELLFMKGLINDEYNISDFSIDGEDEQLFSCVINYNNYQCVLTYLKGFDVYLFTTVRYKDNKELTFEYEFWFEDYHNEELKNKFNDIIADFTTDNIEKLLDKKYPCQIVYN